MVHRPLAAPQRVRRLQRLGDVRLRHSDGAARLRSLGERRRNRRGEGAAGAMRVLRLHPRDGELAELVAVVEEIGGRPLAMPALDHHRLRAQRDDLLRRLAHVVPGIEATAQQRLRLGQVGRKHGGQGQQPVAQGVEGVLPQQPVATLRHHHRIDHQRPQAVLLHLGGDQLDDLGAGEHARLGHLDVDVAHDGVDLGCHQLRRKLKHLAHALGVLRGDGGESSRPVDAQGGERLEIGLDAGATAGVRPGDGQDDRNATFHIDHSMAAAARNQKRHRDCRRRDVSDPFAGIIQIR